MIQVDKIEIGKSVEALHEWHKLALTISVPPGEDPEAIHKEAKALLDKLLPGIDAGGQVREDKPDDGEIGRQFEETKLKINEATTKAAAGQILLDSGFKLNIELKNLVNEKKK